MTTPPPPVVETEPFKVITFVAILIPPDPVVEKLERLVVPVPPVCVNDPKVDELLNVTSCPAPMVKEERTPELPTTPPKVREFPEPGLIVRLRLFTVLSELRELLKVIAPVKIRLSAPTTKLETMKYT